MTKCRAPKAFSLLSLLAVSGCVADDPLDDLELEFRTTDAIPYEPLPAQPLPFDPEPEPEPDPDPIGAEQLVGMHIEELHALQPFTVTYQMDPLPSAAFPYGAAQVAAPEDGWPIHALQWKAYHENMPLFDLPLATQLVTMTSGWGEGVDYYDEAYLDYVESTSVFPWDPNGEWQTEVFSGNTGVAVGLAYAALVMHYWDTPVYLDAAMPAASQWSGLHTIGLQQLELSIPSAPDLLSACGLQPSDPPSMALSTVVTCQHGATLTNDQVSMWYDSGSIPGYQPNVSFHPGLLQYAWDLGTGRIVFDPPSDVTEEDLEGLHVLAEALAEQLLIPNEDDILVFASDVALELPPEEG